MAPDQGGNVTEWTEALIHVSDRGGGSWQEESGGLRSLSQGYGLPTGEGVGLVGFRVASIPEPSTLLLLCFGSLAVLWRRRG